MRFSLSRLVNAQCADTAAGRLKAGCSAVQCRL